MKLADRESNRFILTLVMVIAVAAPLVYLSPERVDGVVCPDINGCVLADQEVKTTTTRAPWAYGAWGAWGPWSAKEGICEVQSRARFRV